MEHFHVDCVMPGRLPVSFLVVIFSGMTKGIVVTFDRLALRMLGCYGSEWVETPNLDRLAASSMVFDRHFAENVDSTAANHAWWSGCYQFPRSGHQQQSQRPFAESLHEIGVQTTLLLEQAAVDRPAVRTGTSAERHRGRSLQGAEQGADSRAGSSSRTGFQQIIDVEGADGLDVSPAETPFARLVNRGIEELSNLKEQGSESWLVWFKSAGVPSPWIPPRDFAELYLDLDEDESNDTGDSGQFVDLSEEALNDLIIAVASLKERLGDKQELSNLEWRLSREVYAGYVSLLDIQLGKLLDAIENLFADDPLLLIVSVAEGEALETESLVPKGCKSLCDESVHTPLLCRLAETETKGRSQDLVQTVDLAATLLEWFGIPADSLPTEGRSLLSILRNEEQSPREYICLGAEDGSCGILTPELYFIRTEQEIEGFKEMKACLFVKPDDVWDIHNLAEQAPEDVAVLSATLDAFLERTRS
jgi:arylsulfatase A-like enzyme